MNRALARVATGAPALESSRRGVRVGRSTICSVAGNGSLCLVFSHTSEIVCSACLPRQKRGYPLRGWKLLRENGGVALLFAALAGSLCANVILYHDNKKLSNPGFVQRGIRTGMQLNPFEIVDKNGEKEQLDFSGSQRTVLYILAPTCIWCKRNQANVTRLASERGGQYRFVGLSTTSEELSKFWKTTTLPFPVYSVASSKVLSDYHFGDETPQMAIVEKGGKVGPVWRGALMSDSLSGAEKYFEIKLPGLLTVPPAPGTQLSTSNDRGK